MEIVDRRVPLSLIGRSVGPAPVDRFLDNVRRHGIVVPVLLREVVSSDGELELAIIDGNRRVAAARHLGFADVPARIVDDISADDAARLTLAGNNFRSANDITEFWAIKHLERSGQSRRRIADDAGINEKYLDLRNRWTTLDRRIFVGFAEGKIAARVANNIARLSSVDQRELGDIFAIKGQVLTHDVERVARQRKPARRPSANDRPGVPTLGHADADEPSVTIVSVPVDPSRFASPGDDRGPGVPVTVIPDGIRQSIASVARMGIAEGITLGDLTSALAMAYREAMDARNGAGEQRSGRDHQS